jgi:iron complex outermembrane receptor protein
MLYRSRGRQLSLTGLATVLTSMFAAGFAAAQEAAPGQAPPANAGPSAPVEEIVVTSQRQLLSAHTEGTTNLPLPIEQVPQSISLVSSDFIESADLKTLGQIASFTPGAFDAGNPENNGSVIKIRGFAAGRAIDGINAISSYTAYEPDYAIFDRLEVVEGPSSVTYGIASPGGLVNFVTKSATSQTPSYLSAEIGSWNTIRVEGQVAGSLDADGRVRAIGLAVEDRGDSFIDELYHHKTVVYGGVNADIADTLSLYVHGGYERFTRPSFDGIPTEADGTPAPVPRSFFLGSQDIVETNSVYHTEVGLQWNALDDLEFDLKGNYEYLTFAGGNDYSSGLESNGDIGIAAEKFSGINTQNYGIEGSSIYHLDGFGLEDSFLSIAALYQNSKQASTTLYPAETSTTNIFAGAQAIRQAFDAQINQPLFPYISQINTETFTISGQSVIKIYDHLSTLLGISYSQPTIDETTDGVEQDFNFPGQVSYRAGLTYEFLPKTNAYFSYSESFNPQPLLSIKNDVLPPLNGEQYEVGVKYRSPNGRLLLTGALFQINQRNLGEYDQTVNGVDFYRAVGEVRHRGVELQAIGQVTPEWQINAGYAYLDPKITQDSDPTTVGKTELFLPKQTFSLYTSYAFNSGAMSGLSFSGGVRFVDSERTSYDGSTKSIPDYTLIDISAAYAIEKWAFQLSIHNLFNETYYINNYQTLFYGNVPGDPRNVSFKVTRTF